VNLFLSLLRERLFRARSARSIVPSRNHEAQ